MAFKINTLLMGMVLMVLLLAGAACQQVETQGKSGPREEKVVAIDKSAQATEKIELPEAAPIAPGTAQILLKVVKILPELDSKGSGPCSLSACKAEVQVQQVLEYGSSFSESLTQGQVLAVVFPMTLQAENGWPGAKVGDVVKAELQAPQLNSTWFSVQHYTLVP